MPDSVASVPINALRIDAFAHLGAIDIDVRRNGYGRQINSFEADLAVPELGPEPFTAVFIRAPVVEVHRSPVQVLAAVDDEPVLCRQGSVLVASFHPELTDDRRLHRYFLEQVAGFDVD